jgi:transcription elongation factor GreB
MKTPLITREGYEKLKKEMDYLWREERPEVTKKVTWAASLGDRSENADYQYNKKRLREIDRRVRYLTKCLEPENRRLLPAAGGQSLLRRVGGD